MSGNGPTVDVIVVGAGLSGLAVAREAARAGARVVVFERLEEPVCALEPGWVMAQADADVSDPFFELRAAGRTAMPGFIAALESESGVRIERRRAVAEIFDRLADLSVGEIDAGDDDLVELAVD